MRLDRPGQQRVAALVGVALAAATACLVPAVAAMPQLPSSLPWVLVVSLLVSPVLEEAVFRAGLHDGLLHAGVAPARANGLTAVCFSAAHLLMLGPGVQHALVVLPALLIGAVYNRWRRLGPCIVLHAAFNGVWTAAGHIT